MPSDPREVLTRPADPPDRTVSYGEHPDQVIDLRFPATRLHPPVVVIHGGFWRAEWDRSHTGPLAADLVARGWPVATMEYRRDGWPTLFEDARTAARRAAEALTEGNLTGPPILLGHSAGAHLALWLADQVPTRGVLALAPVCDLHRAYHLWLDRGAVVDLLGGGPDEVPERYTAVDPMTRPTPTVPVILVHGTEDDLVPVAQSRRYATRHRVRLRELDGIEHFGLIDPRSRAWPAVLSALTDLGGH